jgi:hypothetical protein
VTPRTGRRAPADGGVLVVGSLPAV